MVSNHLARCDGPYISYPNMKT